jgi:hypothetical protein
MRSLTVLGAIACAGLLLSGNALFADAGIPIKYRKTVKDGLNWLVDQQNKRDGHWEAQGQGYPVTMTSLCGMALLCEGSTVKQGKYSKNIQKARDWLMSRAQTNGMLGNPQIPGEAGRYMYGHGFALMFLSSVYGEEDDADMRRKLEDILTRAAKFSHDAQTSRGGWGYVSARDGGNFDEGSVTITQVQALRAARNAGIKVPNEAIKMAQEYLKQSTGADGGVVYSLAHGAGGGGRPALTAAAISCGFASGDYNSPLIKKWFGFCERQVPLLRGARFGHDEYTHYYYAQALYMLGDDGYAKLFPDSKAADRLSWKKYREATFDFLKQTQTHEGDNKGYWTGSHVGPTFATACYLTIMQLDNAALPIYQR